MALEKLWAANDLEGKEMSDEIKKPREWMIYDGDDDSGRAWDGPQIGEGNPPVRVVEYSALEYAQAEIEELKQISSRNADNWVTFLKRSTALEARETELLNLVRDLTETFMSLQNLVDNDFIKSQTEDGEEEYWVSDSDLQAACQESIDKADATLKKLGVTE